MFLFYYWHDTYKIKEVCEISSINKSAGSSTEVEYSIIVPYGIKIAYGVLAAIGVTFFVWVAAVPGKPVVIRDTYLDPLFFLVAGGIVFTRFILIRRDRIAWLLLSAGVVLLGLADLYTQLWVPYKNPTQSVSIADILYLLFPIIAVAALLLLSSRYHVHTTIGVWLDAAIVAFVVAAVGWVAAASVLENVKDNQAMVAINAVYPIMDTLLLCVLTGIFASFGWRASNKWWLLAIGCALFAVSDTTYLLQVANGNYYSGTLSDCGWVLGVAMLSFAAWARTKPSIPTDDNARIVIVPLSVVSVALTLLVIATQIPIPFISIALVTAAILIGSIRAAVALYLATKSAEVLKNSYTDDLTGAGNRRYLNARLDDSIAELSDSQFLSIFIVDINSFSEINDTYGHDVGDALLRALPERINSTLLPNESMARLGSDEFAVLCCDVGDVDKILSRAKKLRESLNLPFAFEKISIEINTSIGVSIMPMDANTREDLLNNAHIAQQRARRTRVGVALYSKDTDGEERSWLLLSHQLREGIAKKQLVCHYQPQLNLKTNMPTSIEVLVRWQHPQYGLVYPDSFIPIAERAGLMGPLTLQVLNTALAQVSAWKKQGLDVSVSVNLSMTNLVDTHLPEILQQLLEKYQLPTSALVLEVTETMVMAEPLRVREVIEALHDLGVLLSVDDYGHAYSSLGQLRELEAGEVKLDRTFVTGLAQRNDLQIIVKSTVELAHNLGIKMIGEGIESAEDLCELRRLGCDVAQGYYICKPKTGEHITTWLLSVQKKASKNLPQEWDC